MTMHRVRVKIEEWNPLGTGRPTEPEPLSAREQGLLDMLRHAGVLESNVKGFPRVIEYTVPYDPKGQIRRWASFGFEAEDISSP